MYLLYYFKVLSELLIQKLVLLVGKNW